MKNREILKLLFRFISEPIKEMKARTNYWPDHHLKMSVQKDKEVPIYGISDDTELLLAAKVRLCLRG